MMWTLIKFKTNQIHLLKKELILKLGKDLKLFLPKIKYNTINKRKRFVSCERFLLGDYIFCYHEKFKDFKELNKIKNTKGMKYFLEGYSNNQNEINSFINKCKAHSDSKGFLRQSFFKFIKTKEYKFISGPFTNFIFNVLEEQKNKFKISIGRINFILPNEKYFFERLKV